MGGMGGMGPSYYDDDDDYDDEYGFGDDVEEAEVSKGVPRHLNLFRWCKIMVVVFAFVRLLRNSWN